MCAKQLSNQPEKTQKEVPKKAASKIPFHRKPDNLNHEEWQFALRKQFAAEQSYTLTNVGSHPIFSDFEIVNPITQKTYKVAIRSEQLGSNFCSCPDYAINTIGTCKHIEYTLMQLQTRHDSKKHFQKGYQPAYSSLYLKYGSTRHVKLRIGSNNTQAIQALTQPYFDSNNVLYETAYATIDQFIEQVKTHDPNFRCYDDAMNYILEKRDQINRRILINTNYPLGIKSSVFDSLLKTRLYDYQKEGILFAVQAGRALIADDMGLGKTIQAIGAMELMAKEYGIGRVLIICPTSLKYQWKMEIEKFTNKSVQIVEGAYLNRKKHYQADQFCTISSYNMAARDSEFITHMQPDLIILDEAQRIKNWKTQTAQSIKKLNSPYAIVLTGTPLENRLEELHSLLEFVDRFQLGPLFKFLATHQVMNSMGKVVGYQNLNTIGQSLSDVVIRRHKKDVLKQLPQRMDKIFFVPMTPQQWSIHNENKDTVAQLVNKWKRIGFLIEKERKKLMICLNIMRMVCDNIFILDQKTKEGPKIDELMTFLSEALETPDEKVVIFSQWERMTRLVAENLVKANIKFESLHGGVPSPKRKDLIERFTSDPDCRIFLSTDAGGIGLNLQCASIVVNLDLPWNPAVLEQRIARVHRMGQKKPVNVINFVSEGTIEHGMLATLKFKQSVFEGVLDHGDNDVFMNEDRFKQFMKSVEIVTTAVSEEETKNTNIPASSNNETAEWNEEHDELIDAAFQPANPNLNETNKLNENLLQNNEEPPLISQNDTIPKPAVTAPIDDLISAGVRFLESLTAPTSTTASRGSATSIPSLLSSLIDHDIKTGKPCIKIPIANEDSLAKVATVLESLATLFRPR